MAEIIPQPLAEGASLSPAQMRKLAATLIDLTPGDAICYHAGCLSRDREAMNSWGKALDHLATQARVLCESGRGFLWQRVLPDDGGTMYFYQAARK